MSWLTFLTFLCLLSIAPYPPRGAESCMAVNTPVVVPPPAEACLHFDAEVTMADGETRKKAGDLMVGDHVSDGESSSTPIIWVPELDSDTQFDFIEFKTVNGLGSSVTPNHHVFAGECGGRGGSSSTWSIKRADDLIIGECVPTANGGEDRIATIERATMKGRVLPITKSGKIAVGGITVSCYNSAYKGNTQDEKHSTGETVRQIYAFGEKIYDKYGESVLNNAIENLGLDKIYK